MHNPQHPLTRRQLSTWLGAAALAAAQPALAQTPAPDESSLAKIKARGSLTVGIYNAMPPFHVAGAGIDVELARELAAELGVKLNLLPFNADENMNDDLRNLVWRGHYLGFGPADVLLHVPVDKPLMDSQPRVLIFAPYYRETLVIARDLARLPRLEQLADLKGQKIAVAGQTLAGWLMIGADNGAYRDQLSTRFDDGVAAAAALLSGEVAAACGNSSELEATIKGDKRFAITPMPLPRAPRTGWAVGMAVKKEATELARALQQATNRVVQDGRMDKLFKNHHVAWRPA